ncbi:MAG TPA: LysM peptidoglycan-binding domain-containing protein [Syntrophales bacterium]|nr:LysM peptidoglycan-binding domain-containing protein [Syntrophales bacterium]HQN77126.1 LysM peptidoglycan-binding domain-containing protein [Syntrophales bacterium]
MMEKRSILWGVALLSACIFAFGLAGCCAKKPAETAAPEPAVQQPLVAEEVPAVQLDEVEEVALVETAAPLADRHVMKKGECLWWISEYEDIYNDPFLWPLLYGANKDQIANPDLIYPGQELKIPRTGFDMGEIQEARRSAGAPRPYTPAENALPPLK